MSSVRCGLVVLYEHVGSRAEEKYVKGNRFDEIKT